MAESAMYAVPLVLIASPKGLLNFAFAPVPSTRPKPEPARIVVYPVVASVARMKSEENSAVKIVVVSGVKVKPTGPFIVE